MNSKGINKLLQSSMTFQARTSYRCIRFFFYLFVCSSFHISFSVCTMRYSHSSSGVTHIASSAWIRKRIVINVNNIHQIKATRKKLLFFLSFNRRKTLNKKNKTKNNKTNVRNERNFLLDCHTIIGRELSLATLLLLYVNLLPPIEWWFVYITKYRHFYFRLLNWMYSIFVFVYIRIRPRLGNTIRNWNVFLYAKLGGREIG